MTQHHRTWPVWAVVAVAAVSFPRPAPAGPNAGGMLVVHDSGLVYSEAGDPPGPTDPPECAGIDAELPAGLPSDGLGWIWKVYAVFPDGSSPRVKAFCLGAEFPSSVSVLAGDTPGQFDFELPAGGWPYESGSGTQVSFAGVRTARVIECYWLAGYGDGGEWKLARHPSQLMMFVDDQFPPIEDQIIGLGSIGFGGPGVTHCPDGPFIGACCHPDGSCRVTDREDCLAGGGIFRGVDIACDPEPCAAGACCLPSGQCFLVTEDECVLAGHYSGDLVPCDPYPCPERVACCDQGICFLAVWFSCKALGGVPYPEYTECVPDLCPQPPVFGACCLPDGTCLLLLPEECEAADGYWSTLGECHPAICPGIVACCFDDGHCENMEFHECIDHDAYPLPGGTSCESDTCPPPRGACCLESGECRFCREENCEGTWLGAGVSCDPDPCSQAPGACCFDDGTCRLLPAAECLGAGGEWQGAAIGCEPNPCVPVPVEATTWGKLKARYRGETR